MRLERGTYIGGQQMAAILGQHPFMSIGNIYAHSAMGVVEEHEVFSHLEKASPMRRGLIMEAGFIDFVEEHVLAAPKGSMARDFFAIDDEVPFFAGTIDAAEMRADGTPEHIHELTTTSTFALEGWGNDGDPLGCLRYKWIQNQWYQGITGADGGTVWLIVADTGEIRRYPVPRKQEAIDMMRDKAEEFWLKHVIPKVPPVITAPTLEGWAGADQSVTAIYHKGGGDDIEATQQIKDAAKELDEARRDVKEAEERRKGAGALLKSLLGDSEKTKWEMGSVSWKRNKAKAKVDLKGVVDDLAARLNLDDAAKAAVLDTHTFNKSGARVLRVVVKKEEQP